MTTAALVLHPIGRSNSAILLWSKLDLFTACGLTFLAFLVSVLMVCRGRDGPARLPSICSLLWGIFAAVLTTAVFLIDIIFVAERGEIHQDSSTLWRGHAFEQAETRSYPVV